MAPVLLEKLRALASVALALVVAPMVRPVPEIVALPVASSARVAVVFRLTAERTAPFTVMPVEPSRAPEPAVSVPPETVVVPL